MKSTDPSLCTWEPPPLARSLALLPLRPRRLGDVAVACPRWLALFVGALAVSLVLAPLFAHLQAVLGEPYGEPSEFFQEYLRALPGAGATMAGATLGCALLITVIRRASGAGRDLHTGGLLRSLLLSFLALAPLWIVWHVAAAINAAVVSTIDRAAIPPWMESLPVAAGGSCLAFLGIVVLHAVVVAEAWERVATITAVLEQQRCRVCGYDLRGIDGRPCPECGGGDAGV